MTERTQHDELNPYERAGDLPVPEVGDLGSFEREPEGGYPDAPEPEVELPHKFFERLDLVADEPPEGGDPLGGDA